jgi:quercetin dioxygenase-like cupin family protein
MGRPTARDVVDLSGLTDELLSRAAEARSRRAASTLPHPVDGLRQTLIAFRAGAQLGDHESPGPASLLVLSGRVRLLAGDQTVALGAHEFSPLPNRRHSLHADEDSVVLLSIAVPEQAPLAD